MDHEQRTKNKYMKASSNCMIPMIECSKCQGFMVVVLNFIYTPIGTLLSVFIDGSTDQFVNYKVLILFIIQLILSIVGRILWDRESKYVGKLK